jgi:adhesin transport system outer membrane protein
VLDAECDGDDSTATIGRTAGTDAPIAQPASAQAGAGASAALAPVEIPPDRPLSASLTSKLTGAERGDTIPRPAVGGPLTLADVVRSALRSSTQVGLAAASRSETEAGVALARAGYNPMFELNSSSGQNTYGTLMKSTTNDYFSRGNTVGAWRSDIKLSGSMMIYDFGAVDADVSRAMSSRDAAALRESAAAEETAYSAAQLYLRVLQSRELLALADENLAALKKIAKLISTNVQNGNATQADIQRVDARVLDADSARADQQLELRSATERFIRTVNLQPGELRTPPALDSALPPNVERGLAEAITRNPLVVANAAVVAAARAEVTALKSTQKPRISLDTSAQSKTYRGTSNKTELDMSAMLSMSYRLADGGQSNAKYDQASARLTQAQIRDLDTRETVEADLRQQFLQYHSAKAKREGLLSGVKTSANARELYQEQFVAGKRTLLELLEVQNAYYSARFNSIVNAADLRLSTFSILRSTGRLSTTILSTT